MWAANAYKGYERRQTHYKKVRLLRREFRSR